MCVILYILDKIIYLLKEQKRNQKELTDYLDLNKTAFTDWKAGKSKSYEKYLPKIARFFNVPIDFFVDDELSTNEQSNRKKFLSDNDIKYALFKGADNITDEMYEEVLRFAEYVLNKSKDKNKNDKG